MHKIVPGERVHDIKNVQPNVRLWLVVLGLATFHSVVSPLFAQQPDASPSATPTPIVLPSISVTVDYSRLDPSLFPEHLRAAASLVRQGQMEQAEAELQRVDKSVSPLLMERDHGELRYYLSALIAQSRDNQEGALKNFKKALGYRASNSDILYYYGVSLIKQKLFKEAASALQEALWFNRFSNVSKEDVFYGAAELALALQAPTATADARASLDAALAANPKHVPSKLLYAQILSQAGERVRSISFARDALAASPNDAESKVALAGALLAGASRAIDKSAIDEAQVLTDQVVHTPNVPDAVVNSAWLLTARSLIDEGNLDEAAKVVDRRLKADPSNGELTHLRDQIRVEQQARATPSATP